YATYDVDMNRNQATLERLKACREAFAEAMRQAGLVVPDGPLAGVVGTLKDYFLHHGDLVFVPLGADSSGILLAHVAARREVNGRDVGGRPVTYRVVETDEAPIEDLESYRRKLGGAPPARPVARAVGRAVYIDRGVARRIARDVVLPRAAHAADLEARVARGEKLSAADEKDLLRMRSLAEAIQAGPEAVARRIEAEEELRLAALLAVSPEGQSLEDPALAARVERDATLAALAAKDGDPRYHLASSLAAIIAVPGTPPAEGARAALAVFAAKPLHEWTVEQLREKAAAALK
ncbi:MAG TPA: hypothetical protein VHF22_01905, partial [Planctomycetota bacterium]|nr:hypothetical protein [Planctomycetota bacterium]